MRQTWIVYRDIGSGREYMTLAGGFSPTFTDAALYSFARARAFTRSDARVKARSFAFEFGELLAQEKVRGRTVAELLAHDTSG